MKQGSKERIRADFDSRLASLSPAKRRILQQSLKEKGLASLLHQTIRRRGTPEPSPLSFAQQRLWFLDQYEPNNSVYNVSSAVRLKGRINFNALKQSLDEIVHRHEALRTTFAKIHGESLQVIAPSLSLSLPVADLGELPASEREDEARRLAIDEAGRPFDLARGPLLRSSLIRLSEEEHILVLVMHHIVSDGWSMGVLRRELTVLYRAFSQSQPSPLTELPVQYADYACWQREWLTGIQLERQLSYWKKQLEGLSGLLNLPTDHPRPPAKSHRGSRQSFELSRELTEGLQALSRREGATLFMTLLAAFQTLLYRYTCQEDIVVGSPIANRNRTEVEDLIGFFVNTLVMRTNFTGDPTFKELLTRVREVALGAYAHQDLPFEKLVEELNPQRSLSHSPLFQAMFVFQNASSAGWRLEGLDVSPFATAGETAKFDLTLSIQEGAQNLRGSLQYGTDLFTQETIARMADHFKVLLDGIVADPERPISTLAILTPAEKHRVLVEWNETQKDYPQDKCFHELFEEQVEKTSDALAVIFKDQQLTYRDLNARANQLAHHLRRHGVGPDVLVGLCMERSLEMLVGLLGILKAGGAYVPLDVEYPKDRLALMLEDSRASTIVTHKRFADLFPQGQAILICLDDESANITQESIENPATDVTPESLAYVIYTSGSTGTPKAVMIEHGSVVNYIYWFNHAVPADKWQILPAITRLAFDASLKQLFAPLLRAGQVWIVPEEVISDPAALVRTLSRHSGTGLNCVPTLWNAVLDLVESGQTALPRETPSVLLLGGEQLNKSLTDRTYAILPGIEIWNLYGPTEATANAVAGRITCDQPIGLGKPIANTAVALLDGNLEPVPVGIIGELYIGGVGLARGYLGRADLTADRFIPNPFSPKPGARLYKTGDLARYRANGEIEFVGRSDNQIKIRGFRVELGDIEFTLRRHRAVREAVVLAREDILGDKRLVAYIVVAPQQLLTGSELRTFVREKLPDYMVPVSFVFLDTLPLSPNGKVDRNALPLPDQSRLEPDEPFSPPCTVAEEMLAGVWAEVLKLDQVGIHNNFFGLGGHSLLATQVVSRVNQSFQIELPLRDLFESPTVSLLAERIEAIRRKDDSLKAPPLLPVSREKDLPLSFSQQRLWFVDRLMPNSSVYNIATAQRLKGPLHGSALEQSINEIVRRHEVLRTTFSMSEGDLVQLITLPMNRSLAVVDLGERPESERENEARRLAREEACRPFDLARGPLFRSSLIRLAEDDHIIVLAMHHIVSDGWSMGVLFRELSVLYEAFRDGKPSPLPEVPIQYADFAIWQREHLQGDNLNAQLSYWKNQLAGIPPLLDLAGDRPRTDVQSHRGDSEFFALSRKLSNELRTLSRREGVTLYMTLLAVFNVLLYRRTGVHDLVVGSPVAGRNRPEIEELIGFFINTLVLRTKLSRDMTFKQLLRQVRKVTLDAFAHQELPFEKLVEVLRPKRHASHRSLVQVAFAFQNMPGHGLELAGLTASPVRIDFDVAKVDLTLFMRETKDGLAGSLNHNTDLFDSGTISRMLDDFRVLLEAFASNPDQRLDELPPAIGRPSAEIQAEGREDLDIYEASNLTRSQLLIWAGQKLAPGVPAYNTPHTFTVHGEVDPFHFQKAFDTLVNSSDALRTVIREIDGVPQQSTRPDFHYQLEYLDLSKHSDAQSSLDSWSQTRSTLSFDFAERLFDSALIKLKEKRFVWYLNVHHIIIDGISRAILFRRLSELYGCSVAGILQDRVELPRFSDYIGYEQEYRRSRRHQNAELYWKRKLAERCGASAFYGKRPATQASRMNRISCHLGVERSAELKLLAGRREIVGPTQNSSIFNVFGALLIIYLCGITGDRRHSIGTTVHNRKSRQFRDTIGLFMEVLPLRITVGEDDTLLSLVNKVKAEWLEVSRFSHAIGNSPRNKAYDVLLNFYMAGFPAFHNMPVDAKGLPAAHENHSLALQIHDFDASGSFVIDFDFHPDVFDPDQCRQAVQHFLQILDSALLEPNQSVGRTNLLTKEEKERILIQFNRTGVTFSDGPDLLPRLFESQAKRTPDQVALLYENQSLTYAELNSRANQLAHHLHDLGAGPDSIVAICLEPSPEAIIGFLGILKAGGAYLPIDPQYPKERLAFMLEDAQASIVLAQKKLLERYTDFAELIAPKDNSAMGVHSKTVANSRAAPRCVVYVDSDWPQIAARSQENPAPPVNPDNLAYIIYTSGSTGTAKGVMVPHQGVCNRLLWEQHAYPFSGADRMLQKSSLAFDTSVLEIFRPLLLGATMIVARSEDRQDCRYLVELIAKHGITVAEFVPSVLGLLSEEGGIENCSSLKHVFSGGEALSPGIQQRFLSRTSSALYNTYGPTEASIDVTHWKCIRDGGGGFVPLGRPIGNTEIYILDRHLNPVPVGVAGELYVGGAGLARGYLNRPELTAEKFVPNPFTAEPGKRLYKTGDLGRFLADGNIEFLGRMDHQVKIRGFRIEPGEVESVLAQHPGVQQAMVLAREGRTPAETDKRLIAYVVPRQSMATAAGDLRAFLRQKLPHYMVPAFYVSLDALPLTPNGKIDLKALPPAPEEIRPAVNESFVAARNPTEAALVEIWARLLGLERVGIHDNFFDLGGHSLLAVRLFAEIEKAFDKRPPLASLFEEPTIEHLAKLISHETQATRSPSLIAIQPRGSRLPFFCVHEFFGDVFCYRNLARHLGEDQPFYALEPRGLDGAGEPFTDVAEMAAYYIEAIQSLQPHGPYALGGLCFGGVIAFEMAQQLRTKGEPVALVALLDSGIRLNCGRLQWWWRFLQNLPLDIHSWLTGCLQLTRRQWLDVLRIKSAAAKDRLTNLFDPSAGAHQQDGIPGSLKRLGEVFQFSERHRQLARAQYRALKSYSPKTYDGRLTLFRARMQPFFSSHDPHKGWSRVAAGGIEVRNVPGNHLGMLQEPHVRVLARELSACLGERTPG